MCIGGLICPRLLTDNVQSVVVEVIILLFIVRFCNLFITSDFLTIFKLWQNLMLVLKNLSVWRFSCCLFSFFQTSFNYDLQRSCSTSTRSLNGLFNYNSKFEICPSVLSLKGNKREFGIGNMSNTFL